MRESHTVELREGGEEVACELVEGGAALLELDVDAVAEVVDGVVAAPENPRVGGQTVVVKLIAAVADALSMRPADRCQLRGRQWLGDEHVVVDGEDERTQPREQRPIRIGRQRHAARGDAPVIGGQPDPLRLGADTQHRGVLVQPHAGVEARAAQPPREPRRVDDRGAIVDPHSARRRWAT